jgi:CBS domain-containing protein
MRIKEIMTQPVVSCTTDNNLNAAAQLMWDHDCGVLPVVGDDGRLAGIITDRDICMAAYTQGRPLIEIPVTRVMTPQVVACFAGDSIDAAERLMRAERVRRIPVVDDAGHPVGIVALNDLARLAWRARKSAVDHDLVQTMAAICQPRAVAASPSPSLSVSAA